MQSNWLALVLLSIFLVVGKVEAIELRACLDHYPPYQDLKGVPSGVHITALYRLARALNKELTLLESPNFARCLAMLKSGEADVVAGALKTPERNEFAFFVPFRFTDKLVAISKWNSGINSVDDFYGKIIGVPRGAKYFHKFDNSSSLHKISIPSVAAGIALVLKERIDIVMTSDRIADTQIPLSQQSKLKVTFIQRSAEEHPKSYFAFSRYNTLKLSEDEISSLTEQTFIADLIRAEVEQTVSVTDYSTEY